MPLASKWLNTVVGLFFFGVTAYRAATQSLTIDEAATYVGYVHHGWQGIFHGPFDANNHILYSVLEKLARQWFGLSEFALRLPALAGAAVFLWSLARLCALLTPGLWFSLLAFLLVAANPLTLDFLVAARGYGLALGLLALALWQCVEFLRDSRWRRLLVASVALGLSAAANLIFAFPTLAAVSVTTVVLLKRQRLLALFALSPAVVVPVVLWWVPFQTYNPDVFYYGTRTMYEAVESFELSVFVHDITRGDPFGNWWTLYYLRVHILPVLVPGLFLGGLVWMQRRLTVGLAFVTFVFAVTCFGTWLAHAWLGILYPQERTGLPLIFLFLLCWTAAIGEWWQRSRLTRWVLALPNLLLALVFLMQFAGQFDTRYFGPWRVNWKMNEAMGQLRRQRGVLRTDWIYQSTAEYYRLRWKLALAPIEREADRFELNNADYFLLNLPSAEQVTATGLRIVYRDEATGTTLLRK